MNTINWIITRFRVEIEKFIDGVWEWMDQDGLVNPEYKAEYVPFMRMLWVGGYEAGRRSFTQTQSKRVKKLDKHGNVLAIYKSAAEAGRRNGLSKYMISKVCLGKVHAAGKRASGEEFYYQYID